MNSTTQNQTPIIQLKQSIAKFSMPLANSISSPPTKLVNPKRITLADTDSSTKNGKITTPRVPGSTKKDPHFGLENEDSHSSSNVFFLYYKIL